MGFSVGGLATGLDTKGIVDQLMSIETRPRTKLEWNRARWDARKSGWSDLNTRLNSLQRFATGLMTPATWTAGGGTTSSDPTKVTVAPNGASPAQGTYTMNVSQLAVGAAWDAANPLAGATAGKRLSGRWYRAPNTGATGATTLVGLKDRFGTALGLNNGSSITMSFQQGGVTSTSTFNVTNTSTLANLATWAQGQVPGSTVAINGDGSVSYTSPPGTADELTSLNFTARNSAGTVLTRFDGSEGAQTSMATAASNGGTLASDTLTIAQGTQTWYVNVAAGASQADIVNAVNATSGIGVGASLVGGKLHLAAKATGAAFTFSVSSAGTLASDLGLAQTVSGLDSKFDVNGVAYTRSTNSGIADVIKDATVDLKAITTSALTINVGPAGTNTADIKQRIKDFVGQYNEVIDFVAQKTGETKVTNPKNMGEYLQGPLARDQGFSSVATDLRRMVGDVVNGLPAGSNLLRDAGITTEFAIGSANNGHLVIDDAKLDAALAADPAKVQAIFGQTGTGSGITGDDGVLRKVSELVSQLRVGGRVDAAIQGATTQMKSTQGAIDRMTERIDRKKLYYEKMFANLETTIGRINSQQGWLSGQFQQMSSQGGF